MTTCFLFPAGQTEISRRGREPGWRKKRDGSPLALDRDGFRQVKALAAQLKGKGATRIYCADVHASTSQVVKNVLGLPIEIDERLRPFNSGAHTSRSSAAIDDILKRLVEEWKAKPEIPMKGGDSLVSYRNRLLKGAEPILNSGGTIVMILDLRNIRFLRKREATSLINDHSIRPDRIYILKREDSDAHTDKQNQAMDIGAERSSSGPVDARVPEMGTGISQPAYR